MNENKIVNGVDTSLQIRLTENIKRKKLIYGGRNRAVEVNLDDYDYPLNFIFFYLDTKTDHHNTLTFKLNKQQTIQLKKYLETITEELEK